MQSTFADANVGDTNIRHLRIQAGGGAAAREDFKAKARRESGLFLQYSNCGKQGTGICREQAAVPDRAGIQILYCKPGLPGGNVLLNLYKESSE